MREIGGAILCQVGLFYNAVFSWHDQRGLRVAMVNWTITCEDRYSVPYPQR